MSTKSKKTPHAIIDHDELPKMSSLMQLIDPRSNLLLNPDNEDWRRRLCYTIMKYASRDTTTTIKEFCFEYGISYDLLKNWIDRYDDVKNTYKNAKMWIGLRRQKKAENKELDGGLVSKTYHSYDDEWKSIDAYNAALRQLEEQKSQIVIIDGRLPKPPQQSTESFEAEIQKILE